MKPAARCRQHAPSANQTVGRYRRSITNLGKFALCALLTVYLFGPSPSLGQGKPYNEGSVWSVSLIKVKPGMLDTYLRDLSSARRKLMDKAKKQGLIVSEKFLIGSASNRDV